MQKTCLERTLSEKRAAYGKKLFWQSEILKLEHLAPNLFTNFYRKRRKSLHHTMTAKWVLLEKFERLHSCLVFICETNVLDLDNNLLCRMKELCQSTKNLISNTENGGDDNNQLWSERFESCYDHLIEEFFKNFLSISRWTIFWKLDTSRQKFWPVFT